MSCRKRALLQIHRSLSNHNHCKRYVARVLEMRVLLRLSSCLPNRAIHSGMYPEPCKERDNRVFPSHLALEANWSSGEINPKSWGIFHVKLFGQTDMDPNNVGYIKSPDFDWSRPELSLKGEPNGLMITDCKSLCLMWFYSKNAVPNCQEWRTTIEVMLLEEQSRDHAPCRWVSTAIMLADCLTKPMDSKFMRTVLRLG